MAARGRGAFTLLELLIATSVGLVITGSVVMLLLQAAVEQRRGLADATVEQQAYTLQSTIMNQIRILSANEGVLFGSPATDATGTLIGYRQITVAEGPAPDYPREVIAFDSTAGQVLYNPSLSPPGSAVPNLPVVWMTNGGSCALRQLYFSPSLKPDGSPDNSLINVSFQLDDNGASGQNQTNNPASICRTFSVQMRNN